MVSDRIFEVYLPPRQQVMMKRNASMLAGMAKASNWDEPYGFTCHVMFFPSLMTSTL